MSFSSNVTFSSSRYQHPQNCGELATYNREGSEQLVCVHGVPITESCAYQRERLANQPAMQALQKLRETNQDADDEKEPDCPNPSPSDVQTRGLRRELDSMNVRNFLQQPNLSTQRPTQAALRFLGL